MSEDEARAGMQDEARGAMQDEEGAEVEAHKRHIAASDEPVDELRRENDDDDFEAHKKPTGAV